MGTFPFSGSAAVALPGWRRNRDCQPFPGVFVHEPVQEDLRRHEHSGRQLVFFFAHYGNLVNIGCYIWRAYCPLPFAAGWSSNLLDPWPSTEALGLCLFVAVILFLMPRPTALVLYVCGTLAVGTFFCFPIGDLSAMRHQGHFFMILVASLWISPYCRESPALMRVCRSAPLAIWRGQQSAFVLAVFAVQCIAGVSAAVYEQAVPFSGSREAADIIRQKAPPNIPIIGDVDFAVAPVSGYLDRPIYIAGRGEYCTYCPVDAKRRFTPLTPQEMVQCASDLMATEHGNVIILVNYNLSLRTSDQVELLGAASRSIIGDEVYLIYRIKYRGP